MNVSYIRTMNTYKIVHTIKGKEVASIVKAFSAEDAVYQLRTNLRDKNVQLHLVKIVPVPPGPFEAENTDERDLLNEAN